MNSLVDILSDDVHELQPRTDKEDYVFDVGRGEPATFEGEHFFHFMLLGGKKKYSGDQWVS